MPYIYLSVMKGNKACRRGSSRLVFSFSILVILRKNENRCLLSNTLATFIHLWHFQNEAHFSPWRFQASETCQQILHRQRSVRFLNCKVLSSPHELYALSVSCKYRMNKQGSQYTHHLWCKMLCAPPWIASNETLMGFHCYICYTRMSVSVVTSHFAGLCLWYLSVISFDCYPLSKPKRHNSETTSDFTSLAQGILLIFNTIHHSHSLARANLLPFHSLSLISTA